jgi:hypothetical protein
VEKLRVILLQVIKTEAKNKRAILLLQLFLKNLKISV